MEELNMILEEAEDNMKKGLRHLEKSLLKIRAGRANPDMLDGILVEYYGVNTPINQLANINSPDARTLSVHDPRGGKGHNELRSGYQSAK